MQEVQAIQAEEPLTPEQCVATFIKGEKERLMYLYTVLCVAQLKEYIDGQQDPEPVSSAPSDGP